MARLLDCGNVPSIRRKNLMSIRHIDHATLGVTHDNVAMAQQLGNTLHISLGDNFAHHRRTNLSSIKAMLGYAFKFKLICFGHRHKMLVVTLATTTQAVVISHNHTTHTKPRHKAISHEVAIWLHTELLVEVRNDKMVNTLCFKKQGSLLNSSKQTHTIISPHSDTRMGIKGDNDTLSIEPTGHSLKVVQKVAMALVNTIERSNGDHTPPIGAECLEAIFNDRTLHPRSIPIYIMRSPRQP